MTEKKTWVFMEGGKRHTQDGCELVGLIKPVKPHKKTHAVDVGCGDGIITSELLKHSKASHVVAFDIQKRAYEAAKENLSAFKEKASIHHLPAQTFFRDKKNWDRYELFVINPPFFAPKSGRSNKKAQDQLARHEGSLRLELWAKGAKKLLRTGGELYCVFPTERLAECLSVLRMNFLEPKDLWWIKNDFKKRRFFLRAVRGARTGLIVHFD